MYLLTVIITITVTITIATEEKSRPACRVASQLGWELGFILDSRPGLMSECRSDYLPSQHGLCLCSIHRSIDPSIHRH